MSYPDVVGGKGCHHPLLLLIGMAIHLVALVGRVGRV